MLISQRVLSEIFVASYRLLLLLVMVILIELGRRIRCKYATMTWGRKNSYEILSEKLRFSFFSLDLFAEAYDALDPNGNITIKWDVMSWTPDGYVVSFIGELRFFGSLPQLITGELN